MVNAAWLNTLDGTYIEGDKPIGNFWTSVPVRPDSTYDWNGGQLQWVVNVVRATVQFALQQAALADTKGFIGDCVGFLGGPVPWNAFIKQYPMFIHCIDYQRWQDLQTLILDAQSKAIITAPQYAALQGFVTNRKIPIVLP